MPSAERCSETGGVLALHEALVVRFTGTSVVPFTLETQEILTQAFEQVVVPALGGARGWGVRPGSAPAEGREIPRQKAEFSCPVPRGVRSGRGAPRRAGPS